MGGSRCDRLPPVATFPGHITKRGAEGVLPGADGRPPLRPRTERAALAPHDNDGLFPSWLGDGDYGTARRRAGYGAANHARLAALKGQYGPTDLFRLMHTIPPVADGAGT